MNQSYLFLSILLLALSGAVYSADAPKADPKAVPNPNPDGPKLVTVLPPPPKPSCEAGKFKCHENKIDALQCMSIEKAKEGPDAEVKWRVIFPCPFGCKEGKADTTKPHCAKLVKKKKPTEEQGTAGADDKTPPGAKAPDAKAADTKAPDAKAGDAKPADAKEGDAKAADPKAADAKAADAKPADAKEGDAKAADPKAADPKAADAKAGDAKPADAKEGDAKAADPKAADPKAADAKEGDAKAPDAKAPEVKAPDAK